MALALSPLNPLLCIKPEAARSVLQGWIPRCGLAYGADWVVYDRHPAHAHSYICVLVMPGQSTTTTPAVSPELLWKHLEGTNRLVTRVSGPTSRTPPWRPMQKPELLWTLLEGTDRVGGLSNQFQEMLLLTTPTATSVHL